MAQRYEVPLAERARIRNWTKARITGFHIDTSVMTENEKRITGRIYELLQDLKVHWDVNSEELGFNVKPYQCSICQRKSTGKYEDEHGMFYCLKHYKEFVLNKTEEL